MNTASQTRTKSSKPGWLAGVIQAGPIVLGYIPIGLAFGVLAQKAGISTLNTLLMSLLVYAGSSQLIAVGLFASGVPALSVILTTFVVNLRHILYGLNIGRKFTDASAPKLLGISFGIVDETYAFATVGPGREIASIPYFMGTALCGYIVWNAGTLVGAVAGQWARLLDAGGLNFAMVAVFTAMVGSSLKRTVDWFVVIFSVVIALIVFGPRKLPELGKSLGRSLAEFKRASNELRHTLEEEIRVEDTRQDSPKETNSPNEVDSSPNEVDSLPNEVDSSPNPDKDGAE